METNEKITINDVAEALGVSKTTVSRAISGKGRIGSETRNKVLQYIEEHNYTPSAIAKSLVESRTHNIAFVVPGEYSTVDISFFQRCLFSISETAANFHYDMIVTSMNTGDISSLERLVTNHKIDGVILARTVENDPAIQYLKAKKFPFITLGTTSFSQVTQIDNDHLGACTEMTSLLLLKGLSRLGLIGGNKRHIVNQKRLEGFVRAHNNLNRTINHEDIFLDAVNMAAIDRAVDDMIKHQVQCIVCMDDYICQMVLSKVLRNKMTIPKDIKIASFYDSSVNDIAGILHNVTSITFDAGQLGEVACKTMIDKIEGRPVKDLLLLGYNITLKQSTQSV